MLSRISGPFKEFGLFGGSLYVVDRVLGMLSARTRLYYHYWMVQPIANKPLLPEKYLEEVTIRKVEQGDPLLERMPIRPEILRSRFEQNAICLALFMKGDFAGFIWFCFGRYEEDEARCTFVLEPEKESVFDFNLYLFPKYRGGIGFLALWDCASRYLRERGIRYSYSRLTAYKQRSAKSHSHFGWKRLGTAVVLRLWALEVIFASRAPYIYVSLKDSSRLPIKLTAEALGDAGGT